MCLRNIFVVVSRTRYIRIFISDADAIAYGVFFSPPAAMGSTFCAATALMSVMMNTECGIDAVAAAKR